MGDSSTLHQFLARSYSLVKRTGLMETAVGREGFRSAYFLYKRWIEDDLGPLIAARPELLRAGNILDIGANIGYTVTVLARNLKPGYKLYAFEPEPVNYRALKRVVAHPSLRNKVVVSQCAVGAEAGFIELWQNLAQPADHRVITNAFRSVVPGVTGLRVPLVSIDDFLQRNPGPVSFAKIDVQGFELPVCQGMTKTLEANPDLTVVLEYAPFALRDLGFDPLELIDFLVIRGFQIYQVHPRGVLSPGIPADLGPDGYVDLLFSRRAFSSGKPR
jgi:FkbM family methyltransferase